MASVRNLRWSRVIPTKTLVMRRRRFLIILGETFLNVLVLTIYQFFELCDARGVFYSVTVVRDFVSPLLIQMLQNLLLTHHLLLSLRHVIPLNLTFLPHLFALILFSCLESTYYFLNFLFLLVVLIDLLVECLVCGKPIALDPMLLAIKSDIQIRKLHNFLGIIWPYFYIVFCVSWEVFATLDELVQPTLLHHLFARLEFLLQDCVVFQVIIPDEKGSQSVGLSTRLDLWAQYLNELLANVYLFTSIVYWVVITRVDLLVLKRNPFFWSLFSKLYKLLFNVLLIFMHLVIIRLQRKVILTDLLDEMLICLNQIHFFLFYKNKINF